jgi:phage repressor protein C with HTH and peptisase S24 domain
MSVEGLASRLRELMGTSSARNFARTVGVGEGTLRAILNGGMPQIDTLATIAAGAQVNLGWLAVGEGEKNVSAGPSVAATPQDQLSGDFAFVPRLVVQPSAGRGSLVEHEDAVDMIAFQASWLRRRGVNPSFARAMTVRGDSMEPTIRSGDVLLIDTSKNTVEDNGIYVVFSNGYVLVKRIHPRRDGSIMLISDNQAYPAEDVPAQEASDFRVAGRVMWFGRSI